MPKRNRANIIFIVLMCLAMCSVMSLAMTLLNRGLDPGFFRAWLRSASIGFLVALPTALLIVPPLRRFSERLAG
ncbi:MAG: DUF2798 domain-containing protein [Phycisphaeraceae bacterium]|nr:MAG: DUF2798 domain-containing protein [Phycisphaeraceae bacterium]